jgi:hypothetical protein
MKRRSLFGVLLAPALLAACATGPKLAEINNKIPPVAADASRVWFYRTAVFFGDGLQPDIFLNGKQVGKAAPSGFFFVDTKPGPCKVSTSTEVERDLTFEAPAGGQNYVKISVAPGILVAHLYPELVDPTVGSEAIQSLHFTGTLPAQP